jgi:energy-coupling factor transporter ATP-binding protein EcfA2
LLNLNHLLKAPFVLIWGCPGGGKTTLAKRLAALQEAAGHTITVADPHGSKAEWGNWDLVGAGRNFEALNQYLEAYDAAITTDYERYATGEREFDYQTLIVDEFTQWADRCPTAPLFVKSVCTDLQKICRCAIVVSHADTITGLGNAVGLRAAINRAAIKIELETQISRSGEYVPTGEGWLQYPGKERQRVRIPHAEPA